MPRQPMPDMVVVIPGILGSVLELDGKEVWGLSGQAIAGNLLSLGRNLRRLELAQGIGDDEPRDGVKATRLMPDLHLLPGFWTIDGYGQLLKFLRARFTLTEPTTQDPGNLLLFPYDWRLSNVASARQLASAVVSELDRWRKHTQNREAKFVFICHSMGGLVARWFLEVLGGRKLTRQLITIGTPYQGSVNALEKVVNGFALDLGPLRVNLTLLVRSLPSVYQLMPTYQCLNLGDGVLHKLTDQAVPNVDVRRAAEAAAFHGKIAECVAAGGGGYEIIAIKGFLQPTAQSALLRQDGVEPRNEHKGVDHGGDGTVPRPSSHPPEWGSDTGGVFAAQKHASLQNTGGVLDQLYGGLTGRLGNWMGGFRIGIEVPGLVSLGEPIPVVATVEGGDLTLPLQAIARREDGSEVGRLSLQSDSRGSYTTSFAGLSPGSYRVTVESERPERPVDPVTDIAVVWDPAVSL